MSFIKKILKEFKGKELKEKISSRDEILFDIDLHPELIFELPIGEVITVDGKDYRILDKATHRYVDNYEEKTLILENSSGQIYYLSYEDDLKKFYLFEPIEPSKLNIDLVRYLMKHDDLPSELQFEGKTCKSIYNGTGAGYYSDSKEKEKPFITWTYVCEEDREKKYIEITQWGDEDFEVSVGKAIDEITISTL